MNKYEEAFENIKATQKKVYHGPTYDDGFSNFDDYEETIGPDLDDLEVIKELVDKATPKKPIVVPKLFTDYNGVHNWVDQLYCPICGSAVIYGRCCQNNDCRQAIDWDRK